MDFWQRTWNERGDEVRRRFGQTEPPGYVTSFSWNDVRLPGACALTFPPVHDTTDPRGAWHSRADWLYLTLGLTQPLDEKQVRRERKAGKEYSSHGFELGLLTRNQEAWAPDALYLLLSHVTERLQLKWGDRFAFGFHREQDGSLGVFTGLPSEIGFHPEGDIRALLFWPYLFPDSTFVTSTGKDMILIGTGITEDEWDLAKKTTTAQVLLLLCRAGIGQRTDPDRTSVLSDPRWHAEWHRIEQLGGEKADAELESGIGQWHLARHE